MVSHPTVRTNTSNNIHEKQFTIRSRNPINTRFVAWLLRAVVNHTSWSFVTLRFQTLDASSAETVAAEEHLEFFSNGKEGQHLEISGES